jgi:hypothetical protein
MRTTLNLDDDLMRAIKRHAAETGRTVTSLVESALREFLGQAGRKRHSCALDWVLVEGGTQPGVDLTDRDALIDHMEKGS